MRRMLSLVLLAVFCTLAPARAQELANVAKGFNPSGSFATGDVDNVNLFNGNLVLRIPLGQSYPVNGGLSYGLTLVYNSQLWEYQSFNGTTRTIPSRVSNAGLGWMLSLGRLNPPTEIGDFETARDTYMGPDGARHTLYPTLHEGEPVSPDVFYSRDGSYLRFKKSFSQVEFPDGTTHTFNAQGMPTRIEDRFSNAVQICYDCCPQRADGKCTSLDLPWPWKITDSQNRQHWVRFRATGYPNQPTVVDRVELETFNNQPAVYSFAYTLDDPAPPASIVACKSQDDQTKNVTPVHLKSVTRPDGSSWTMPAHFGTHATGPCKNGIIRQLGLPTLGTIEWDYITYSFPPESTSGRGFFQNTAGVGTRTLRNEFGTPLGTWTYTTDLTPRASPGEPYKELVNTVTDPLGHRVRRYFSVCPENCGTTADRAEYGLPLSRLRPGGGTNRFLSSEVIHQNGTPLRSTYVRYERDANPSGVTNLQDWTRLNQRQVSQRTVFQDDGNLYAEESLADFDGYGHHRSRTTGGNLPGSNVRSSATGYNPPRGTYGQSTFSPWPVATPWVLGTYSFSWESEGGQLQYSSFCFDQNGFLLGRRIHAANGSGYSVNDLVEVFANDGRGNVQSEKYFGGDLQAVTADPIQGYICTLTNSLTHPVYKIDHTYLNGSRATTSTTADGVTLNVLNQVIDKSTGLPSSSRDTANQLTTFLYDNLGRLTRVTPPEEVATTYGYVKATPGVRMAQVTVSKGVNGPYGQSRITFDAFGRPVLEEQRMPDESWADRTTDYNALGWKTRITEPDSPYSTQFLGYDPFGRPATIQPPDGQAHNVTLTYAGVRQVTRETKVATEATAESAATTKEIYDRHGRLIEVTEPNGVITRYEYNAGNRLTRVCQNAHPTTGVCGQERVFTYDNRGFLLWENHPEKTANALGLGHDVDYLSYDARGHVTRKVDGASDLTFLYDKFERLTEIRQTGSGDCIKTATGTGPRCLKSFTYAGANLNLPTGELDRRKGKLIAASRYNYIGAPFNAVVEVKETYQYAGKGGRLSQKETHNVFNGAQRETFRQTFTWNDGGELASHTYPDCATPALCGSAPRTQGYGYTYGRLTSVPGFANAITYHPSGLIASVVRTNGVTDVQGADPNGMARPAEISAKRTSDSLQLWTTGAYRYDGTGNVWKTGQALYLYDSLSRVTSGKVYSGPASNGTASTQSYTYDNYGNLTGVTTNGTVVNTPAAVATNRLTAGTYDAAGNLTAWSGNSYEYDAFHQMSRHVSSGEDWRYMYTADDERFWAFRAGGGGSIWTLRGLGGEALREYSAHINWSSYRDHIYRNGTLLATAASAALGGSVKHLHTDHLGTPRLITDAAGSPATAQYHAYHPYGEELAATYTTAYAERMRFTGHERDLVNPGGQGDDLDYMHARHYGVVVGRFLSVDPVGGLPRVPQSWNRYSYVLGRTMTYSDPYGLSGVGRVPPPAGMVVLDIGLVDSIDVITSEWRGTTTDPFTGVWGLSSLIAGGGFFGSLGDLALLRPNDFSYGRFRDVRDQGMAAFADGVIPFGDPFESAGAYDSGELGLGYSQDIGALTRDVELVLLSGGATLETRGGASTANYVTKNIFRWGRSKRYGLHFHLGPGNAMKHHLPKQFNTWRHHAWAIAKRSFGK